MEFPDQKRSVRAGFGPAAPAYASAEVHRSGPDLAAMVAASALSGREHVLDVGCGAGHTAVAFAPLAARVEALDLTEEMLEQTRGLARERGVDNLHTQLGDAEALPYPADHFERVTCRLCAHHFPHPGRALAEIARVLKPGGLLLLADILAPETPAEDTFLNALERMRDPSHVRDHSLSQWWAMLGAAGLAPELLGTWPIPLDFESWVARIGASPGAVSGLRVLFASATSEARTGLSLGDDLSFTLCNGLIRARHGAAPEPLAGRAPRSGRGDDIECGE